MVSPKFYFFAQLLLRVVLEVLEGSSKVLLNLHWITMLVTSLKSTWWSTYIIQLCTLKIIRSTTKQINQFTTHLKDFWSYRNSEDLSFIPRVAIFPSYHRWAPRGSEVSMMYILKVYTSRGSAPDLSKHWKYSEPSHSRPSTEDLDFSHLRRIKFNSGNQQGVRGPTDHRITNSTQLLKELYVAWGQRCLTSLSEREEVYQMEFGY